jgi:hypothetical protein
LEFLGLRCKKYVIVFIVGNLIKLSKLVLEGKIYKVTSLNLGLTQVTLIVVRRTR